MRTEVDWVPPAARPLSGLAPVKFIGHGVRGSRREVRQRDRSAQILMRSIPPHPHIPTQRCAAVGSVKVGSRTVRILCARRPTPAPKAAQWATLSAWTGSPASAGSGSGRASESLLWPRLANYRSTRRATAVNRTHGPPQIEPSPPVGHPVSGYLLYPSNTTNPA